MKKGFTVAFFLVLLSFVLSIGFYSHLPKTITTHWGIENPDGQMDKDVGLFLLPVISLFVFVLVLVLPRFDPICKNAKGFEHAYVSVVVFLMGFMVYIHLLMLMWNAGFVFSMNEFVLYGLCILFMLLGWALPQTKRNWFMGIRTPWSLSSDKVWQKTHDLGGKLFYFAGFSVLGGIVFKDLLAFFVIVPVIVVVVVTYAMSYVYFKKIN